MDAVGGASIHGLAVPAQTGPAGANGDYPWDSFDSSAYLAHNYSSLRDDDRQILEAVRDYFASTDVGHGGDGVDVGSGTNLYPALSMLPFCSKLTLWEYSASNRAWLAAEIAGFAPSWDHFWQVLAKRHPYQDVDDPRLLLAERASVADTSGSVFDLPLASWDIGTMFFVAESLTSEPAEFESATHTFVRALRRGAPFAAAFMENSVGYDVGATRFPAVAVTVADVRACLDGVATGMKVERIEAGSDPVRDGYTGMIYAMGRARG